jgi:hypothetical protein
MTDVNHFESLVLIVYTILQQPPVTWPSELSVTDQQTLIKKMIDYFSAREDYEKCANLEKTLNTLLGESKL